MPVANRRLRSFRAGRIENPYLLLRYRRPSAPVMQIRPQSAGIITVAMDTQVHEHLEGRFWPEAAVSQSLSRLQLLFQ